MHKLEHMKQSGSGFMSIERCTVARESSLQNYTIIDVILTSLDQRAAHIDQGDVTMMTLEWWKCRNSPCCKPVHI